MEVPRPVAAVEDDGVAVAVDGHARELPQLVSRLFGRPVGHGVEAAAAGVVHLLGFSRWVV